MTKQRKQEFISYRTSWKWFENKADKHLNYQQKLERVDVFQTRVLIEILKELQYLNDSNPN